MMKFIADENIPSEVILKLKNKGYDIISVGSIKKGLEDLEVVSLALHEKRTIITFDVDFGEIIFKLNKPSKGVIILRVHPQNTKYITSILLKIFKKEIKFDASFCVVEKDRVKIIPLF